MRRAILFLLIGLLVFPMLSGCAKELTDEEMFAKLGNDKILARASEIIAKKETPPAAALSVTTAMTTIEPTETPEKKLLAPINLLGKEFNPFYDVDFPEGYEPYAAKFDTGDPNKNEKPIYSLYLTAKGDPAAIVDFAARLAGIDDEASIGSFAKEIKKSSACIIDGTSNGKGMNIVCGVKKTQQGSDYEQCDDVDGCRLELIALIDKESIPEYRAVFTDNYNFKIFGSFSESFTGSLIPDRFSVTVNTQKPKFILVSGVHQINDPAALIKSMSENLKYDWYDKEGICIGLSYGRINTGIKADVENNLVTVEHTLNDAGTASRDYIKPDVSLSTLGFGYSEKDALCVYENNGYRVAVHKPEWGQRKDKWNIEFFYNTNGYNLAIWYIESEQRYTVQVDKGSSVAKYDYYAAENRFGDEYPNQETIQKLFEKVFGNSEAYQYQEAIDKLNKYFSDTFGMTLEKLYALPAK